jgi:hypothetical protein
MDCISRHDRSYPVIADIGANCHMFKEREFFSSLMPTTGKVLLGDGKTSLTIQGIGTVTCKLGQHKLVIPNVRYIPELGESIYSLFQHIQSPEHGLHSSFEGGLSIIFPKFSTQAIIGDHDIYLDIVPCSTSLSVSDDILIQSETTSSVPDNFCRNVIQLQQNLLKETNHIDGLLCKLRHYYQDVKTKRQLGLDVPAGFRVASQQEQNRRALVPPCKSIESSSIDSEYEPITENNFSSAIADMSSPSSTVNSGSESIFIPIVRSVDKASTFNSTKFSELISGYSYF